MEPVLMWRTPSLAPPETPYYLIAVLVASPWRCIYQSLFAVITRSSSESSVRLIFTSLLSSDPTYSFFQSWFWRPSVRPMLFPPVIVTWFQFFKCHCMCNQTILLQWQMPAGPTQQAGRQTTDGNVEMTRWPRPSWCWTTDDIVERAVVETS